MYIYVYLCIFMYTHLNADFLACLCIFTDVYNIICWTQLAIH